MDVSPYLFAVQSLNGEYPGDKYKELHSISAIIIDNEKERTEFVSTGFTERVQPALLPHLRILVGNKLKLNNFVIEALKSDDVTIIKQALSAKWFFNSSNALIDVDYFVKNVVPYISLRTRLELVKTLAHCLVSDSKKANDFFTSFTDLYGLEQALPLIVACSEEYIFDVVLKRRIVLSSRLLVTLYRRYPQLVIRYLQLGNDKNEANKEDRKIHSIGLYKYAGFLPILIKHHTQVFIEFHECLPFYEQSIRLGSTRAKLFLKNATEVLIKKPQTFLKLLPLKLVSSKLSTQQFETMFENLFPKEVGDFSVSQILNYLQYYPQEKKFYLLMDTYKRSYQQDMLDNKTLFKCLDFYKLLPTKVKEECGKKIYKFYEGKSDVYDHVYVLPPKECITIMKERITKPSDKLRCYWINKMIVSCSLYNSKEQLLQVLSYYDSRHKNEEANVLHEVLSTLVDNFDIALLDKEHWQILKDIIQRAYVKGNLFGAPMYIFQRLFKGALHYFFKQCRGNTEDYENKAFLDRLIGIIIECYIDHNMKWEFITRCAEFEKDCLQKFLIAIIEKYPEADYCWNKFENKLSITSYLIRAIHDFNIRNFHAKSKKKKYNSASGNLKGNEMNLMKIEIKDYPWLIQFVISLLKSNTATKHQRTTQQLRALKKTLRDHDPDFYQSLIDMDPELINDVESNDALILLKNDHSKILAKWELYLTSCKIKLQLGSRSVKHFLATTKWHQEIPLKFVNQCMLQVEEKSNICILGILLEGQVLGNIIKPYLPKDKKLDIAAGDAKKIYDIMSTLPKAINFTNPPASFEIIASFCQGDFVSLAAQTLTNVAQRVPMDKVLAFAHQLLDKPISVKKLGIRLVHQVAPKKESREFLTYFWKKEKNPSMRKLLAEMIFLIFKQSPSAETWQLMKVCISDLTCDDETIVSFLLDFEAVDVNYVALYIQELFTKIDEFTKHDLYKEKNLQYLGTFVRRINKTMVCLLPEELLTKIITNHFFNIDTKFLSELYLLSDSNKFQERLQIFSQVLYDELKNFNKPDLTHPRYYPTNSRLRIFMKSIIVNFSKLKSNDKEQTRMILEAIDEMLAFFSATLAPWKDPWSSISLNICKGYYEAATPKQFGHACAAYVQQLVANYKSEFIVNEFIDNVNSFLLNLTYTDIEDNTFILTMIEGLMERDQRYGALIGLKLLNRYKVSCYDNRYDEFIKICREINDRTVIATLHQHVNELSEYYF